MMNRLLPSPAVEQQREPPGPGAASAPEYGQFVTL